MPEFQRRTVPGLRPTSAAAPRKSSTGAGSPAGDRRPLLLRCRRRRGVVQLDLMLDVFDAFSGTRVVTGEEVRDLVGFTIFVLKLFPETRSLLRIVPRLVDVAKSHPVRLVFILS